MGWSQFIKHHFWNNKEYQASVHWSEIFLVSSSNDTKLLTITLTWYLRNQWALRTLAMQKHTWISCLCVPIILSGTHRMINAHQYWFSSSPFKSIPFIYPTKLCLSLLEWKRHRDLERVGNSGNSAHWALMYRKGFKTVWLKRHHSPPQSHFLSGLPVYTCCPRWAGWPIFSLNNNT